MTIARKDVVVEGEEGIYHCVSRCVRRAFLCGEDPYSGINYDHRKEWVRKRLEHLTSYFGIDVCAYALLSNHVHCVLRTCPDKTAGWEPEEVAERWLNVFPVRREEDGSPCRPRPQEIGALAAQEERIEVLRARLGSISWLMRCLNEYIAKRANHEDGCTGRFWEGRFRCQRLLDEGAVLACMAYVDLNPVRAKLAETPETSEFTSAYDRIKARQAREKLATAEQEGKEPSQEKHTRKQQQALTMEHRHCQRDHWLAPIEQGASDPSGMRGVLPMSLDAYLELLDWTGRAIRQDKPGAIPEHLAPILNRLKLEVSNWERTVARFGGLFYRMAGPLEALASAAAKAGRHWFKGVKSSQSVYKRQAS